MSRAAATLDVQRAPADTDEIVDPTTPSDAASLSITGAVTAPGQQQSDFADAELQACLSLIQRAASAARAMQQQAHAIAREAYDSIQRSTEAVRAAEQRARQAEAEVQVADARADQAEAMLTALQVKLLATEKRMHEAELRAGLAQEQFKILCARIEDEFECLTVATPPSYGAMPDRPMMGVQLGSFPVRTARPVLPIVSGKPNRQAGARIR